MRIENNTVDNRIQSGPGSVEGVGSEGSSSKAQNSLATDTVRLSDARHLVALARDSTSAVQRQRLESVTSQLRSGQYQTDLAEISHAVVTSHLQG